MPSESLEHLIYAPVPFKGYAIRATSAGAVEEEFKEATKDWFVPFDESLFQAYSYESCVVNAPFNSRKVYLSRIFRRPKLDDLGRDGQVCHIVSIPLDLLQSGALSIADVNDALAAFEEKNGHPLPIGAMPSLDVESGKESAEDPDLKDFKILVPQESARKLVSFLQESSDTKVFLVYKRSYNERIFLAHAVSKFLLKVGLPMFTVTSDCPMEVILNYFSSVVISDYVPHLKPNSNWKILNLTPAGNPSEMSADKRKMDDTFRNIYGTS